MCIVFNVRLHRVTEFSVADHAVGMVIESESAYNIIAAPLLDYPPVTNCQLTTKL